MLGVLCTRNQIFGEALYYPESDGMAEFPSPESLKGRILISTKPPKEYLESECSSPTGQMDEPETDCKVHSEEYSQDFPERNTCLLQISDHILGGIMEVRWRKISCNLFKQRRVNCPMEKVMSPYLTFSLHLTFTYL
ncbi:hypothetical protein QN277_024721 [Acacia crassicarpa]|uniref:Phosphatidylinositol-specific phospholipase C X domain-containing protein n=1 Tax=Acacia crassicarpa TaxID=499986 RepID=A0AAE1MJU9_9FABA|nr:hypothetical protein QN277_024721 [Acacia crassicarpa]